MNEATRNSADFQGNSSDRERRMTKNRSGQAIRGLEIIEIQRGACGLIFESNSDSRASCGSNNLQDFAEKSGIRAPAREKTVLVHRLFFADT